MGLWRSAVDRFGRTLLFARMHKRLAPLDGWLFRVSGGRLSTGALAGRQQVLLTTTGRRTGQPRTVPLICARDGERFVVVGSNYGQANDPAWVLNLLANPAATVQARRVEVPVRGRLVEGDERARLWSVVTRVWPAYDTYAERAAREIKVFVLEPVGSER